MRSGVYKSIDLYGPEIEEGIEEFSYIFKEAEKLGIKKKAHVGEFSNAHSVRHFVDFFSLTKCSTVSARRRTTRSCNFSPTVKYSAMFAHKAT